jgi:hypothetical protein
MMLNADWIRGPLVLMGADDLTMWPLLPPGSLLQIDPKHRAIKRGKWTEFDRPIYLIERNNRLLISYAERKGKSLILISHPESPAPTCKSQPFRDVIVRGQLLPIFRPLAK